MPYNFTYLVLISKIYKLKNRKKKNKGAPLDEIIWSNPEEEIFAQVSGIIKFFYVLSINVIIIYVFMFVLFGEYFFGSIQENK